MLKLVVLFAVVGAAVSAPGALISTPLLTYSSALSPIAPTTYVSSAPLLTSPYASIRSPFYSAFAYGAPAHFIKKRSVGLAFPSTYIAPGTYAAPYLTTTYTAATRVIPVAPVISHAPLTYAHLIKKRSAPLLATTYLTPTAYSSQSRVDIRHTGPAVTTTYSSPQIYSSPQFY